MFNLPDDKKVNKASVCQLNNSLLDWMEQLERWHHRSEAILEGQDGRHRSDNARHSLVHLNDTQQRIICIDQMNVYGLVIVVEKNSSREDEPTFR